MAYLNPDKIIVDFLRNNISDPRSSRVGTSTSDSFTASASQTTFQLTPSSEKSLSHVTSVTVDAGSKDKWEDYYIDAKAEQIVFFSAMSGGEAVVVNYVENSTNWIFDDKPVESLGATAYPRISVQSFGSGDRLGNFEAPVSTILTVQVDIWCKERSSTDVFTVSSRVYTGEDLCKYLGVQVSQAFEDSESDLHPVLYNYVPKQTPSRPMPFDLVRQAHHRIVEFSIEGLSLGRTA